MTRKVATRSWVGVLPVAAIAMVAAASLVPAASVESSAPRPIDIVETSYACPSGTSVSLAAGQVRAGEDRSVRLSPDGSPSDELADARSWSTASIDAAGAIVTETGRDVGASGFFGNRASAKSGGGLVVGQCPGVLDEGWFLGAGSGGRHFSTLLLTNLSSTPAVADIKLWGQEGPVDAVGASGITVDPYEVRRVPLADLAAGEPALAVQVVRTRGSMAAALKDTVTSTFAGTEPIGPTRSPRRDQYIGGIVSAAQGKTMLLLNPGQSTARVDIDVLAGSGTFAGKDLQDIKVDPGQYREITVPTSVGGGQQAFHVVSDQPVAASVRVNPTTKDFSVAEATVPLDGDALVPVSLGTQVRAPELVLTAPGKTASVGVEAFDASMKSLGSTSVDVDGGSTVKVSAVDSKQSYADDVAYVVVRAGGDVIAAANYVTGDGVSSLALQAAPVAVSTPSVRRAEN